MSDESAFPNLRHNREFADNEGDRLNMSLDGGLTKRELFAAMAMQGLCSSLSALDLKELGELAGQVELARTAVSSADALIERLDKEK